MGNALACFSVGSEAREVSAAGKLLKSVSLARKRCRPAGDRSSIQLKSSFISSEDSAALGKSLARKPRTCSLVRWDSRVRCCRSSSLNCRSAISSGVAPAHNIRSLQHKRVKACVILCLLAERKTRLALLPLR